MTIRWITDRLGTAPASIIAESEDLKLLDVRSLVDKGGNPVSAVKEAVEHGVAVLARGSRLVVGCDYGISRSNAIAAGILSRSSGRRLDDCLREVLARTGGAEIKLEMIDIVRSAVEPHDARKAGDGATLLTGGSGFLGAAVARVLRKHGAKIVSPTRSEIDILRDRALLALKMSEAGVDCVIHLANPRVYTSNIALGETLTMLRNVMEACVRTGATLIYPSGWEVYSGYRASELRVNESTPLCAKGPYGDTKFLAEILIEKFRNEEGLECGLLRFGPVYGPGSERPKFLHTFIEKALAGKPISTHVYRNGRAALDLLHVDDAVDAIARLSHKRVSGNFNIGTGVLTETRTIAEWMLSHAGREGEVEEIKIDDDVARISIDASRASRELGWRPTRNLKDEIHKLFQSRMIAT